MLRHSGAWRGILGHVGTWWDIIEDSGTCCNIVGHSWTKGDIVGYVRHSGTLGTLSDILIHGWTRSNVVRHSWTFLTKQDQRSIAPPLVSVLQLVNQSTNKSVNQSGILLVHPGFTLKSQLATLGSSWVT